MPSVIRGNDSFDSGVAPASIGVGQSWRTDTTRSANTWYHNNSSIGIMVQCYTYHGPIMSVGPSTSSYTDINQSDQDSDLDNPMYVIVPAYHYWRVNGVQHDNSSNRQNILD
jgi:hypothetical protein